MFEDFICDAKRYPLNKEIYNMTKEERMKQLRKMVYCATKNNISKKELIEDLYGYTFTKEELIEFGLIEKGE